MFGLFTPCVALAQEPPSVYLEESKIELGRPLVLKAEGLERFSNYNLKIKGPNQEVFETTLRSNSQGKAEYKFSPGTQGVWVVALNRNNFTTSQNLIVSLPSQVTELDQMDPLSDVDPLGENTTGLSPNIGLESNQTTNNLTAESSTRLTSDLTFDWDGRELKAVDGQATIWSLSFPAPAGPIGPLIFDNKELIVGLGNSLLRINPDDGTVIRRDILPNQISEIVKEGDSVIVTVTFTRGYTEQFTVSKSGVNEIVRFETDPLPFSWLRAEAKIQDIEDRMKRDTTNPWLHIALINRPESDRRELLIQAIESATTFYDLAKIARVANEFNQHDLLDKAMNLALVDFATRGYDPRLLTDIELHELYAFPMQSFRTSLETGDLNSADSWVKWVYLLSTPEVPETRNSLLNYAAQLRSAGRNDEALLWQSNARELGRPSLAAGLDNAFLALGRTGWLAAGAVFISILTLHLTLMFKYWGSQTIMLRNNQKAGRKTTHLTRLLAIRYYSLKEKMTLIMLLLIIFLLALLAGWADRADAMPSSLRSGTLSSSSAWLALQGPQFTGPRAHFLEGYASHIIGDLNAAMTSYKQAGNFAPAINNLAALTGSEVLYQRASDLQPELGEARYNLGRITSPLPFHEAYRPGQPLLASPTTHDLLVAWTGGWHHTLINGLMNPWKGLINSQPDWGSRTLWLSLVVLFLLFTAATIVWLIIPRPRLAQRVTYNPVLYVLAILVPGTGLAESFWGILLLSSWAVFGFDLVSQISGWQLDNIFPIGTDYVILGIVYSVNVVVFTTAFIAHRRRLIELK